jgi:hypothetical protein
MRLPFFKRYFQTILGERFTMMTKSSKSEQQDGRYFYLGLTLVFVLGLVVVAIAMVTVTYLNWQQQSQLLTQQAQQQQEQLHWRQLHQAEIFAQQNNPTACLQILEQIPEDSGFYDRSQVLAETCYTPLAQGWLQEAKALSAQGKLRDAIAIASQITGGSLEAQAQQSIKGWSQQILTLAEQRYYTSEHGLNEAIGMVNAIPEYSPLYEVSVQTINQWQQEWTGNQHFSEAATHALTAGDLSSASQSAEQISQHPLWAEQRSQLLLDIQETERQLQQMVYRADQLIAQGLVKDAEALIQQLPDASPWYEQKVALIQQVKTAQDHQGRWAIMLAIGVTLLAGRVLQLM